MTPGRTRTTKGRFGWRQPRYKDPAFLVAVGVAFVAICVQALLSADLSAPLTKVALVGRGIVTWVVVSAIIRIRVGIRRGLITGFAEAEVRAEQHRSSHSTPEALARSSGRTLGRMVGAYKRVQESKK